MTYKPIDVRVEGDNTLLRSFRSRTEAEQYLEASQVAYDYHYGVYMVDTGDGAENHDGRWVSKEEECKGGFVGACEGCGDAVREADATWHNGCCYCPGCESAPADD